MLTYLLMAVLPNLCATRAITMCRSRMSEVKSFQREVSMKLSTLIENVSFSTYRPQSAVLPLYQIWEHFPKCCKFEIWLDKWIFLCKWLSKSFRNLCQKCNAGDRLQVSVPWLKKGWEALTFGLGLSFWNSLLQRLHTGTFDFLTVLRCTCLNLFDSHS